MEKKQLIKFEAHQVNVYNCRVEYKHFYKLINKCHISCLNAHDNELHINLFIY